MGNTYDVSGDHGAIQSKRCRAERDLKALVL